jgi:uncharacterized membrane protein
VRRYKRWRDLIPAWNMPSDPVKAVWWFLHWFLKVLMNFFWLPIAVMVIYEGVTNGLIGGIFNAVVSGIVTLLIGLVVWGVLSAVVVVLNISTGVSQLMENVKRGPQQDFLHQTYNSSTGNRPVREERVVEGTITDLDEERQKRRS